MPNSGSTHSNIKTIRFDLKNIGNNSPFVPKYNGYLFNSVAFLSSSSSTVEQQELISPSGATNTINTHISNLFNIYNINEQNNGNTASDGGLLLFGFYQEELHQSKKGIMIAGLGLDSNNNAKSLIVSADIPNSDITIQHNNSIIDRTKTYDILIKQFISPTESTIIFKLYNKIDNNTNIVQWAIDSLS